MTRSRAATGRGYTYSSHTYTDSTYTDILLTYVLILIAFIPLLTLKAYKLILTVVLIVLIRQIVIS